MVGSSEKCRTSPAAGRMRGSLVRGGVAVRGNYGFRPQWSRSHGIGLIGSPPFGCTSKCRCGPVVLPVIPTAPTWSPAYTVSPTDTLNFDMWLYQVTVPSSCRTWTWRPYGPAQSAKITTPFITELIRVPIGAAKSRPVWLWAHRLPP